MHFAGRASKQVGQSAGTSSLSRRPDRVVEEPPPPRDWSPPTSRQPRQVMSRHRRGQWTIAQRSSRPREHRRA
ncbi:MAG: hypothetical protein U0575_10315 [Phycisphaerales bacterium]